MKSSTLNFSAIFSAIFFFALTSITVPNLAKADDLDIFSASLASNPPVNVLFVFDISGSMGLKPDGTPASSLEGPDSRYGILMQSLKDVLDANKTKTGLRVGVSWFNRYISGVQWPISEISDDAHTVDTNIPVGDFQTFDIIPEIVENDSWVNSNYETKMVPALLDAAYYFRGDPVWKIREPKIWNAISKDYDSGNSFAVNPAAYTATPASVASGFPPYHGTHAYVKNFATAVANDAWCNTANAYCHDGYNPTSDPAIDRSHGNVRDCDDDDVDSWSCPVTKTCTNSTNAEGHEVQSCSCPVALVNNPYEQDYCTWDYWYDKKLDADYNSPISSCSTNIIVLLSDGKPTRSENISGTEALIGASCADDPALPHGKCGPELVRFLANNDQVGGIPGSKVSTYTIGFNADLAGQTFLQALATEGSGQYYEASNAASLTAALTSIINSVSAEAETFVGLSTSTQPSTISSSPRVFMNLFNPVNKRAWNGNTKGYFASSEGLKDLNGDLAVEVIGDKSQFKATAQSFWSAGPDGNVVEAGGMSAKLPSAARSIYSYTGPNPAPDNSALTLLAAGDASINPALFGVADHASKDAVITWLETAKMADSLHSKPVVLSYPGMDIMFTMTNQGLLHAVDVTNNTAGGNEIFAFVPQALLSQLKDQQANASSSDHLYGLDGSISYFHDDSDNDHVIDGGEKVYLYFGMRRGGNHYYALDVTDLHLGSTPDLQWRIDGGAGAFAKLGQTWSRMVVTKVPWSGGTKKSVLIFGGGYDTDQDSYLTRTVDDIGTAVYMVDAQDGDLVWSAQNTVAGTTHIPALDYSIPSDITVIDTNNNQLADRLYFGDMGGQLWRIDLDEASFAGGTASASYTQLADLATNAAAENRRFYYPPSVALIQEGGVFYHAVAIGSGWRAKPLTNAVDNKFFMIRDTNVSVGPPALWTTKTVGDLYDIDSNLIGEGPTPDAARLDLINNHDGWVLSLANSGEKALSESLIFDNTLLFTTLTPSSIALGCGSGTGRLYVMNLFDGVPVLDFVADSNMKAEDRQKKLPGSGIPTVPVPWFPEKDGRVEFYVGKDRAIPSADQVMHRINWKVIE